MYDQRTNQLADVLIHHSTKVQPGEVVLIEAIDVPEETIIPIYIHVSRQLHLKPP